MRARSHSPQGEDSLRISDVQSAGDSHRTHPCSWLPCSAGRRYCYTPGVVLPTVTERGCMPMTLTPPGGGLRAGLRVVTGGLAGIGSGLEITRESLWEGIGPAGIGCRSAWMWLTGAWTGLCWPADGPAVSAFVTPPLVCGWPLGPGPDEGKSLTNGWGSLVDRGSWGPHVPCQQHCNLSSLQQESNRMIQNCVNDNVSS